MLRIFTLGNLIRAAMLTMALQAANHVLPFALGQVAVMQTAGQQILAEDSR